MVINMGKNDIKEIKRKVDLTLILVTLIGFLLVVKPFFEIIRNFCDFVMSLNDLYKGIIIGSFVIIYFLILWKLIRL